MSVTTGPVYLKDGAQAYLNRKLTKDAYIVQRVYIFDNGDYGDVEEFGPEEVVDKIYRKPPVQKFVDEIKELKVKYSETLRDIREKNVEIKKLQSDISELNRKAGEATDLSKLIINRNELLQAKTIHAFVKEKIVPVVLTTDRHSVAYEKIKISFAVSVTDGNVRASSYYAYGDNQWSNGISLDYDYPLYINKTDEEMKEISKKRCLVKGAEYFSVYSLKSEAPNEWIPKSFIAKKKRAVRLDRDSKIAQKRKLIKSLQLEIKGLLEKSKEGVKNDKSS